MTRVLQRDGLIHPGAERMARAATPSEDTTNPKSDNCRQPRHLTKLTQRANSITSPSKNSSFGTPLSKSTIAVSTFGFESVNLVPLSFIVVSGGGLRTN